MSKLLHNFCPFDSQCVQISVLGVLFVCAVLDFSIIIWVFLQTGHPFFLQRYTSGTGQDRVTWFCPFTAVSIDDITIYVKTQINILKAIKIPGLKF